MSDAVVPAVRGAWRSRARFFHAEDTRYLRFLIPPGLTILELGCGAGHTLAALQPSRGVGVETSPALIEEGRATFPALDFRQGDIEDEATLAAIDGTFDIVLLVDTLGWLRDCQAVLQRLTRFCTGRTRLVLVHFSHLWRPLLKLAELTGWKQPEGDRNVLAPADVRGLAELAGFQAVRSERRLLSPARLLGIGRFANRFLACLPLIRQLDLRHYTICRLPDAAVPPVSASVVIPARNERGNIAAAVERLPDFVEDLEIVFVEGGSSDGTFEEMQRVRSLHPDRDIKVLRQPGKGKADAVFAGFAIARGEVLMILDADLTVPPEQIPRFYEALRAGRGEFVNGTRLVYPMESGAMRYLNLFANRAFSILFSWLLGQRLTDTLCGTKALRKSDYERIRAGRAFFGDFDPFGDFDLIFGATRLGLKTVEVPVRYAARTYGETQISRFRHGWLLLRMIGFAFLRIKAL